MAESIKKRVATAAVLIAALLVVVLWLPAKATVIALTVVVLTTSNEDRDRVDAYQLNVAGYLLKPVTLHAFADVMATLNKYWTLMEMT